MSIPIKANEIIFLSDAIERAAEAARMSECLRRKFGAVVIDSDDGFVWGEGNNSPSPHIGVCSSCLREAYKIPPRLHYEMCRAVHAEQAAMFDAISNGGNICGKTVVIVLVDEKGTIVPKPEERPVFSCTGCARVMDALGIRFLVGAQKINDNDWEPYKITVKEALENAEHFTREQFRAKDLNNTGYQ